MQVANTYEQAEVFAALSDETRLTLIAELSNGERRSITQLAEKSPLSRQAITKHLRVLEGVGIVHSLRSGRQNLFELDPEPLREATEFLDVVSEQWDRALMRLKKFVEE